MQSSKVGLMVTLHNLITDNEFKAYPVLIAPGSLRWRSGSGLLLTDAYTRRTSGIGRPSSG